MEEIEKKAFWKSNSGKKLCLLEFRRGLYMDLPPDRWIRITVLLMKWKSCTILKALLSTYPWDPWSPRISHRIWGFPWTRELHIALSPSDLFIKVGGEGFGWLSPSLGAGTVNLLVLLKQAHVPPNTWNRVQAVAWYSHMSSVHFSSSLSLALSFPLDDLCVLQYCQLWQP